MTSHIRSGVGHQRHRRERAALRTRVATEGLRCTLCGQPFDLNLPANHPRALTYGHPHALANGGALTGQAGEPQHRDCNARLGHRVLPTIRPAS